jgi:NTE family protein
MHVLTGLRMTISVPFMFTPVKYESKFYVDGGIMNNYPINLFYNNLENVIGVYLSESREIGVNINNIEAFITNMIECIFEGMSKVSIGNCTSQTMNIILPQSEIL